MILSGPSWDQDRPLRNHAVRDFREGPDCRGGSIPARKAKRQSDDCLARGPSWDQDRPLRNHAVRDFREGPDCRGGSIPARKAKRQSDDCLARGPSWDRTSDPLIMSQVL